MIDIIVISEKDIRYCINYQFNGELIQYIIPQNLCRLLCLHYFSSPMKLIHSHYHRVSDISYCVYHHYQFTGELRLDTISNFRYTVILTFNPLFDTLCISFNYQFIGEEK